MSYTKPKLSVKHRFFLSLTTSLIFVGISVLLDFMLGDFSIDAKSLVIQGILFGVLFGLFFPKLLNVLGKKLYSKIEDPELGKDEQIIQAGPANLYQDLEGVGGKLFLTNKTLIFKSHKYNIQNGQVNINLSKIVEVTAKKTLKIIDNSIRVHTLSGLTFDFVVNNKQQWMKELQKRTEKIK